MYFLDLNIPFADTLEGPARAYGVPKNRSRKDLGHSLLPKREFNPEILKLFEERDVGVILFELFYTPPRCQLAIHIDGPEPSNICKLNWVFGGTGSRMMWWNKNPASKPVTGKTPVKTFYLRANAFDCRLAASKVIGKPTLVNVGQYHSIINPGSEARFCLSAVLVDLTSRQCLDINDAANRLKDFHG